MDKEVLVQWNPWWENENYSSDLISREILKNIEKWINRKEIVALIGVRRSGKTSLMYLLIKKLIKSVSNKNVLFVKCDDERVEKKNLIEDAINTYKELMNPKGKIYVFLDEIQELENWEKTIKRIYDLEKNIKIFISGSNSSMLKEDLSSKIAGRIAYFEVYPFSFREFLSTKIKIKNKISILSKKYEIKHYLLEYIEFGGFPEVLLEKDKTIKNQLLRFYFDTIIFRDVLKRRKVRNAAIMERLVNFYLQNVSNLANYSKIAKLMNISTDTVSEYTKYLQDAFLVFVIPIFAYSVKKQEINPKKVYCVDSGLRNVKGFRFSEDYGRLVENIVFVELKRRNSFNPLAEIFYWQDNRQKEVDFLIKNGLKSEELIQVCWNINNERTKEREVEALIKGMKKFKLEKGTIITEDYEAEERHNGKKIRFLPLWKWLLNFKRDV